MKKSGYCFGRKPKPVPTFLDITFPSFSNIESLSRTCRVVNPTRLATHAASIVASSRHAVRASINWLSVTFSLNTMLQDNGLSKYIYLIMPAYIHPPNHECMIRYIYQIWRISTRGDLHKF